MAIKRYLLLAFASTCAGLFAIAGADWLLAITSGVTCAVGLSCIGRWLDRRDRRAARPVARRAAVDWPPFFVTQPDATMPHPLVPVGALHLTDGLCYKAPDPPKVEPRGSHA